MRIGQLASAAGVDARTIRFYESKGLLLPASRSSNRYRQYTDKELSHLLFIRRAQTLGLSLKQIQLLMQYKLGGRCSGLKSRLDDLLAAQIAELQKRAEELLAFSRDLERIRQHLQRTAKGGGGPAVGLCDCLSATILSDLDACARKRAGSDGSRIHGQKGR